MLSKMAQKWDHPIHKGRKPGKKTMSYLLIIYTCCSTWPANPQAHLIFYLQSKGRHNTLYFCLYVVLATVLRIIIVGPTLHFQVARKMLPSCGCWQREVFAKTTHCKDQGRHRHDHVSGKPLNSNTYDEINKGSAFLFFNAAICANNW